MCRFSDICLWGFCFKKILHSKNHSKQHLFLETTSLLLWIIHGTRCNQLQLIKMSTASRDIVSGKTSCCWIFYMSFLNVLSITGSRHLHCIRLAAEILETDVGALNQNFLHGWIPRFSIFIWVNWLFKAGLDSWIYCPGQKHVFYSLLPLWSYIYIRTML